MKSDKKLSMLGGMTATHKLPRLYTPHDLNADQTVSLDNEQTHYLRNVMRMDTGATLRLFNGRDGEWRGQITALNKKHAQIELQEQILAQPQAPKPLYLLFAPIKKQRMDMLIEKAVELGATHLMPILTEHTENRKFKPERVQAQIIEACEQCERLDIPALAPAKSLKAAITHWPSTHADTPLFWCAERSRNAQHLRDAHAPSAFLIGPEGGFSSDEFAILENAPHITAIHLGTRILRAETAALFCLANCN